MAKLSLQKKVFEFYTSKSLVQCININRRRISDRNWNQNKQAYCLKLSYFYNIKIDKLNVISLLICVSISIGNPPRTYNYKLSLPKNSFKCNSYQSIFFRFLHNFLCIFLYLTLHSYGKFAAQLFKKSFLKNICEALDYL